MKMEKTEKSNRKNLRLFHPKTLSIATPLAMATVIKGLFEQRVLYSTIQHRVDEAQRSLKYLALDLVI